MSLQYMNMDIPQDQSQYRAQMLENHGMASQSNTPLINGSRSQPQYSPRGTASAPAHVAFRSSPEYLPSPAELDFDISPLTSPWLGAHQQSSIVDPHVASGSTSQKRTASPNSVDHPARKKQSPAIRPTNPGVPNTKKNQNASRGGSKSVNSTPLLRSTRTRKGSTAGDLVGDTPSPVDLSMPPPASTVSSSNNVPPSTITSAQLTPVTPASIMKLGRLGVDSSLAPKPSATKIQKKSSSAVQASPGLKAILPAGSTSSTASHSQPQQPVIHVRKTSHKAAEQKRRDSLKTTFDELRGLLPPIPLPNDEKYPDEPILPGALPPRGPPKAGSDGPNKGVSKLQLLICGNDYIRQLKGRVERRDDEIEKLRREVKRLRLHVGDAAIVEGEEELDLEFDLDAAETLVIGRGKSLLTDEEGEEETEET
ncbi:hypothetical protein BDN71DRAFT_910865 [Pleurotus eryngii]|uniref:BHLH domain-containing protein n=1 Tax=Pleurotus eryngii TaxID=5323 RepID=A0A9P5ZZ93_PLEER|nr:hypothetical protein BDN71DRAFT_910865 [Pleurotus eryngii]